MSMLGRCEECIVFGEDVADGGTAVFPRRLPGTPPPSRKPFIKPKLTGSPSKKRPRSTGQRSSINAMLTSNV